MEFLTPERSEGLDIQRRSLFHIWKENCPFVLERTPYLTDEYSNGSCTETVNKTYYTSVRIYLPVIHNLKILRPNIIDDLSKFLSFYKSVGLFYPFNRLNRTDVKFNIVHPKFWYRKAVSGFLPYTFFRSNVIAFFWSNTKQYVTHELPRLFTGISCGHDYDTRPPVSRTERRCFFIYLFILLIIYFCSISCQHLEQTEHDIQVKLFQ